MIRLTMLHVDDAHHASALAMAAKEGTWLVEVGAINAFVFWKIHYLATIAMHYDAPGIRRITDRQERIFKEILTQRSDHQARKFAVWAGNHPGHGDDQVRLCP